MLEQLFGSKTRVRLLRLFLHNPEQAFFVRQLSRKIGAQINGVRNELENLVDLGVISVLRGKQISDTESQNQQKKFYSINTSSLLYPELRELFIKARLMLEKDFVRKIGQTGTVSYLLLTGFFVGLTNGPTDIFVVGRVSRDKLAVIIHAFEREVGRELNYTIMTPQEFKYRRDVTDRFLYSILESKKIVVVDELKEKEKIGVMAV